MNSARRRLRAGGVLLEALVALAILGTTASAAAWRTAELLHSVRRVHERESEVRAAQRLLSAASLWPGEDLDRRLGDRRQGGWLMRIDRVGPDVYEVVLRDTASGGVVLRTAFFRPAE